MTLGELIKQYRTEHGLSQSDFARVSGFSRGYVSMLENNKNPQSGLPIALTLETMQRAAHGMGISINDLFSLVDEQIDISIAPPATATLALSPHERQLILSYRSHPEMQAAVDTLLGLAPAAPATKNA